MSDKIIIGELIIPKQTFDTFFRKQLIFFLNIYRLILLSFDAKHRDNKEVYECLGYIAQKIRYRTGAEQDQCFVNIIMIPF